MELKYIQSKVKPKVEAIETEFTITTKANTVDKSLSDIELVAGDEYSVEYQNRTHMCKAWEKDGEIHIGGTFGFYFDIWRKDKDIYVKLDSEQDSEETVKIKHTKVFTLDNKYLGFAWVPSQTETEVTKGPIVDNGKNYCTHSEMTYGTDKAEWFAGIFSKCLETPFVLYIGNSRYDIPHFYYTMDGNLYEYEDDNIKFGVMMYSIGVSVFVYDKSLVGTTVALYMVEKDKMPGDYMPDLVSPNGTKYKLVVSDDGVLSTQAI